MITRLGNRRRSTGETFVVRSGDQVHWYIVFDGPGLAHGQVLAELNLGRRTKASLGR
jgi:hypothetical protein